MSDGTSVHQASPARKPSSTNSEANSAAPSPNESFSSFSTFTHHTEDESRTVQAEVVQEREHAVVDNQLLQLAALQLEGFDVVEGGVAATAHELQSLQLGQV